MQYDISFSIDFRRNPYKGRYLALEGLDGAGKTVQIERVAAYFREKGYDFITVTEPRRTGLIGRVINEFLQKRVKIHPVSLQYLFCADRIVQQEEIILPALKRGQTVISHRCFWSSVPYGIIDRTKDGYSLEVGNMLVVAQSILSMYYQVVVPDVTFFLDLPAETAFSRLKGMGIAREYYETKKRLINVKKGYDWMLSKFSKEFTILNGNKSVDEVMKSILNNLPKELQ